MPGSHRRNPAVVLALAVALVTAVTAAAPAQVQDDGPRNPAAVAASGDTRAMLVVVQDIVDCLRAQGWHPGDARVDGPNVVISDWNPTWDSAADRATRECAFPEQ
jgi:hypothetical protein